MVCVEITHLIMSERDAFVFTNARQQYSDKLRKIYFGGRIFAADQLAEI